VLRVGTTAARSGPRAFVSVGGCRRELGRRRLARQVRGGFPGERVVPWGRTWRRSLVGLFRRHRLDRRLLRHWLDRWIFVRQVLAHVGSLFVGCGRYLPLSTVPNSLDLLVGRTFLAGRMAEAARTFLSLSLLGQRSLTVAPSIVRERLPPASPVPPM
jgi:hypothetical protein